MNQKIEADGVILRQLDRQANLLVALKNKAYTAVVLAEASEADAKGCLAAYREIAKTNMYSKISHLDLYYAGDKFWVHEGPNAGEYIFQDQVIIDDNFDWRIVTEKVMMTSKGKPSKAKIRMNFLVDYLAAHGKKTPLKIVAAPQ